MISKGLSDQHVAKIEAELEEENAKLKVGSLFGFVLRESALLILTASLA